MADKYPFLDVEHLKELGFTLDFQKETFSRYSSPEVQLQIFDVTEDQPPLIAIKKFTNYSVSYYGTCSDESFLKKLLTSVR